jgi:hypothetical protein
MLAMTLLAVGALLGCASDDRDSEDTVAVASNSKSECSDLEGQNASSDTDAQESGTAPENTAPTAVACQTDGKRRTEEEPDEDPVLWPLFVGIPAAILIAAVIITPIVFPLFFLAH